MLLRPKGSNNVESKTTSLASLTKVLSTLVDDTSSNLLTSGITRLSCQPNGGSAMSAVKVTYNITN